MVYDFVIISQHFIVLGHWNKLYTFLRLVSQINRGEELFAGGRWKVFQHLGWSSCVKDSIAK